MALILAVAFVQDVDELVSRLGSASREIREDAVQSLIQMGPSIRPDLEEARERAADPDVRNRLDGILWDLWWREILPARVFDWNPFFAANLRLLNGDTARHLLGQITGRGGETPQGEPGIAQRVYVPPDGVREVLRTILLQAEPGNPSWTPALQEVFACSVILDVEEARAVARRSCDVPGLRPQAARVLLHFAADEDVDVVRSLLADEEMLPEVAREVASEGTPRSRSLLLEAWESSPHPSLVWLLAQVDADWAIAHRELIWERVRPPYYDAAAVLLRVGELTPEQTSFMSDRLFFPTSLDLWPSYGRLLIDQLARSDPVRAKNWVLRELRESPRSADGALMVLWNRGVRFSEKDVAELAAGFGDCAYDAAFILDRVGASRPPPPVEKVFSGPVTPVSVRAWESALARMELAQAREVVREWLGGSDPTLQATALDVAEQRGIDVPEDRTLALLESPSWNVQRRAAAAAGRQGIDAAWEPIIRLAAADDRQASELLAMLLRIRPAATEDWLRRRVSFFLTDLRRLVPGGVNWDLIPDDLLHEWLGTVDPHQLGGLPGLLWIELRRHGEEPWPRLIEGVEPVIVLYQWEDAFEREWREEWAERFVEWFARVFEDNALALLRPWQPPRRRLLDRLGPLASRLQDVALRAGTQPAASMRGWAAHMMGFMEDQGLETELRRLLQDPDDGVRRVAAKALARSGSAVQFSDLVGLGEDRYEIWAAAAPPEEWPAVREAATRFRGSWGPGLDEEAWFDRSRSRPVDTLGDAMLQELIRRGDREAIALLREWNQCPRTPSARARNAWFLSRESAPDVFDRLDAADLLLRGDETFREIISLWAAAAGVEPRVDMPVDWGTHDADMWGHWKGADLFDDFSMSPGRVEFLAAPGALVVRVQGPRP